MTHHWPWASQRAVDWRTSRPPINGPTPAWGTVDWSASCSPINGPRLAGSSLERCWFVTHQWPWASQGTVDWRTSRPPINGPARHVCQSTAWGQPGGSIDRCHMRPINGPRPFSLLGLSPRSQVDTFWAQAAGAAGKVAVQVEKAAVLEAIKSSRRQKKKGRRR